MNIFGKDGEEEIYVEGKFSFNVMLQRQIILQVDIELGCFIIFV